MTNMKNTGTSKQPNSNPVPDWEPEDDASSLHSDCNSHHSDDLTAEGAPSSPSVKKNEGIAKKEDTAVNYLRLVVLFVLVAAAVGVSLAVYFYLHHAEQSTFEDQFESDASKIFAAIGTTLDNTLGPADALIVNVLAYAKATNQTMPFVTLPSYGLQAAKLLRIAKSFQIQWSMYVQPEELNEWRDYANRTHPEFVDYALDIMESDPQWTGLLYKNYSQTQCYDIFTWGGVPVTEPKAALGFFGPNWMEYPIMSGASGNGGCPYNYDHGRLEVLTQAILFMMHHQKAVIGNFPTVNFDESDPEQALQKKILADYVSQFVGPEIDPSEPYTQLAFPILDHSLESLQVNTSEQQTVHGHVALNIQFRSWIENVLPEQSNGLIMVVDQGLCGVPFTFRMDGAHVTFLGTGDQHEAKFDDMVRTQVLEELMDTTREMDRQSTYTGPPVSPDFCPNTLKIYPSQHMQDNHLTDSPAILAAVAACIFFFTSFVFLLYDVLVAKRQRVVMSRALESGAIVSSLFPEAVREKLYEENRQRFQNEQQVKMFQRRQTTEVSSNNSDSTNDIGNRGPAQIAKLYPHTTIFFADLAGFTSWSSQRQPHEVFHLLESLYGAFDKIAERRNVYKVETIGDCFVAITGCPEPQDDHAVIMVKFARDCMNKMHILTRELADNLGQDTIDLGFRVGLHSGQVTGGVLRGQRARFQLFGDSVNTAARMESNGVKGRIHVSQTTADELSNAGKAAWLTTREEKIVAKGKGSMQTYFVTVTSGSSKGTASVRTSSSSRHPVSDTGLQSAAVLYEKTMHC